MLIFPDINGFDTARDGGQPRVRGRDQPLAAGDELALIPPVSGGATTAPARRDPRGAAVARRAGRARARPARGRRR